MYNFEGGDDFSPSSGYDFPPPSGPAFAPVYSGGLDSPAARRRVGRVALAGTGKGRGGVSTQALGEISDFPDIDEDVRIKDAKQQVPTLGALFARDGPVQDPFLTQVRDCFFASTCRVHKTSLSLGPAQTRGSCVCARVLLSRSWILRCSNAVLRGWGEGWWNVGDGGLLGPISAHPSSSLLLSSLELSDAQSL